MHSCAICCDDIKEDGFVTPCNHHMHNSCLTHWLLLKDDCPICRYDISGNSKTNEKEEYFDDSDDEYDPLDDIEVNFSNEVYTSNYDTILNALKEILFSMTLTEEEESRFIFRNNWIYDSRNKMYNLKINTRNQIININVDGEVFDTTLYIDINFESINKKHSHYISLSRSKNALISNYTMNKLPTRINCY